MPGIGKLVSSRQTEVAASEATLRRCSAWPYSLDTALRLAVALPPLRLQRDSEELISASLDAKDLRCKGEAWLRGGTYKAAYKAPGIQTRAPVESRLAINFQSAIFESIPVISMSDSDAKKGRSSTVIQGAISLLSATARWIVVHGLRIAQENNRRNRPDLLCFNDMTCGPLEISRPTATSVGAQFHTAENAVGDEVTAPWSARIAINNATISRLCINVTPQPAVGSTSFVLDCCASTFADVNIEVNKRSMPGARKTKIRFSSTADSLVLRGECDELELTDARVSGSCYVASEAKKIKLDGCKIGSKRRVLEAMFVLLGWVVVSASLLTYSGYITRRAEGED